MCAASHISSIISIVHLTPISFASSMKLSRRQVGVSILTGSMAFVPYTIVKGVSFVVECGVVW